MQPPKATGFTLDLVADLNRWRAFVAIGELGSLTRATLFLDTNQSLLSRQLNALERECGARLFNRTGRGVELSDVGQRLFPQVKALLDNAQQLETDIRSQVHEPIGRVTLALLPSVGSTLVGRLFREVQARYPAVSLRIFEGSTGQVEEWLADARADIAIFYRYGATLPEGESSLAFVDSYLVGPAGDPLTAPDAVSFSALEGLPLVLPSAPNGLRNALESIARESHTTLQTVVEADSLPVQKLLCAEERLYTVLPIHAVWNEINKGTLQAARIIDPPFQRTVTMAFAKAKGPSRAVTAVASQLTQIANGLAAGGLWHIDRAD